MDPFQLRKFLDFMILYPLHFLPCTRRIIFHFSACPVELVAGAASHWTPVQDWFNAAAVGTAKYSKMGLLVSQAFLN